MRETRIVREAGSGKIALLRPVYAERKSRRSVITTARAVPGIYSAWVEFISHWLYVLI